MTSARNGTARPSGPGGTPAAGTGPAGDPATAPPAPQDGGLAGVAEAADEVLDEDRPPPAGPVANALIALGVIALGLVTAVGAAALELGTASAPRPGLWPFLIGIALVVFGVGLLALVRRTADAERFTRASWLVVAGLATMVAFVALVGVIGFEIPATLLLLVWLRLLGREGWRLSLVTSVAAVVAFYLVFVVALSVPIPHLF